MIYTQHMITYSEAQHNFRIYRVVRLLHDMKVVSDLELIRHEEAIYKTKMVAATIDWYNFRMRTAYEVIQL